MPIVEINGKLAFVRLEIDPAEITVLLARHGNNYPPPDDLELLGAALVTADFHAPEAANFVGRVCLWGGGQRLVGRVLGHNTEVQIANALRDGYARALAGNVGEGVARIGQLEYLQQSFASKQLRFLIPTYAVILDDVIRTNLGYQETVPGYEEFLEDCGVILKKAQLLNIRRPNGQALRIADVEAAVFAKIQGY